MVRGTTHFLSLTTCSVCSMTGVPGIQNTSPLTGVYSFVRLLSCRLTLYTILPYLLATDSTVYWSPRSTGISPSPFSTSFW